MSPEGAINETQGWERGTNVYLEKRQTHYEEFRRGQGSCYNAEGQTGATEWTALIPPCADI